MYKNWFLDYASYVILERAIPDINDGLKPVQKRILYSMREMHDGRYNKVANIIGHTMQYHPHGDQAIGDALVGLGQKNLLIDAQGNWGDTRTGDRAAAPRYIEARLSTFALTVLFNKNITVFQPSYDGRKNEPVSLPVRFPLVLSQGAEGIAVGLSTKILPHNFNELIKSSISILKENPFKIFPDFQTGGLVDISSYNKGKKGGKVKIRSHIDIINKTTLKITSVPYGITTTSLIDSIIKANESGKIKIKHIEDNTSEHVDIQISLVKGISPNVTIDALFAFTSCEVSISPNCCIIVNNKPEFITVNELLRISTNKTLLLLEQDLLFNLKFLELRWHTLSLEKIFIENKIYRKIEDCETLESIIDTIKVNLKPHLSRLAKAVTDDDISALIEIKIKKISKFDADKHKDKLKNINSDIEEVKNNIKHIKNYAIRYFEHLLKDFGVGRERKTEIASFDSISVRRVAIADKKLFISKKEGFIGTYLKDGELVSKCSQFDNIIIILSDGTLFVTKIDDKKYVGKNIIYASVWKKNDKHMIYNVAYVHGKSKFTYVKRFAALSLIIDKKYNIAGGCEGSKIVYLTANPNSESEVVQVFLHFSSKVKNKAFEYDYSNLAIKGRDVKGNILTKFKVRKIMHKESGDSTLGGRKLWIDPNIGRLNTDNRGDYLGSFNANDSIITFFKDGTYETTNFDLSNRYKLNDIFIIKKMKKRESITTLYYNGETKFYYIKRFKIETNVTNKKFNFISESRGSKLILISTSPKIQISYSFRTKSGEKKSKNILNDDIVDVKGWKSIGNRLDNKLRMSGFSFKVIEKEEEQDKEVNNIIDVEEKNKNIDQSGENLTLF